MPHGNHRTHPTVYRQREEEDHFQEVASFSGNELALDVNTFTKVFRLDVQKGRGMIFGRGQSENPLTAQGFIAANLHDNTATTAVQILGDYKITVRPDGDPGTVVDVIDQGDLENIDSRDASGNLLDRRDRVPFALRNARRAVTHEYSVYFEVQPESAATIDTAPDSGQTEIYIDGHKVVRAG